MNTAIIRISSTIYFVSLSLYFVINLNPSNDVDPVILNYLQWWYSNPLTNFEFWLTKVSMVILLISVIFSIALLFIKRWAAIGFLISATFLVVAELFLPHHFPLSRLEATLDAFSMMAYACILVVFLLESKLKTFTV